MCFSSSSIILRKEIVHIIITETNPITSIVHCHLHYQFFNYSALHAQALLDPVNFMIYYLKLNVIYYSFITVRDNNLSIS